jgi:hypothetical protein
MFVLTWVAAFAVLARVEERWTLAAPERATRIDPCQRTQHSVD